MSRTGPKTSGACRENDSRLLAALVLALAGCGSPAGGGSAASAQLGSALDQPAKPQPVDAAALCRGADLDRSVLLMPYAEASLRAGPHRYLASSSFRWEKGKRAYSLSEEVRIERGGDDFRVRLDNDKGQSLEIIRKAGRLFLRNRDGKFQLVEEPGGHLDVWPDRAAETGRNYLELFGQAIELKRPKRAVSEGQRARACRISLSAAAASGSAQSNAAADTLQGLRPRHLSGEVLFDETSAVPVSLRFEGQLSRKEEKEEATLTLKFSGRLSITKAAPAISEPKDFLPSVDIEQVPADRIEFWAGKKAPQAEEPAE